MHIIGIDKMVLPTSLAATLETQLGAVKEVVPVSGGDISRAARVSVGGGQQVLVKWRTGLPLGLFTAERRGLELLGRAETLRVPQVLAQSEPANGCPAYIVLEWLGRGTATPQVEEALGQGLARLHQVTAREYGLEHDNFIGANPQPNQPANTWIEFFRDHRLGYQAGLAAQKGHLPKQRARLLEKLQVRLGDWLPELPPASLLHGDLWGGNWLTTAVGQPALIDPAVYYGHREAEIAFTELFGGFSSTFYAAYNQIWPLDSDYSERKDLYNLYHLLNHLNLFGESYGGGVDSILRRYVG